HPIQHSFRSHFRYGSWRCENRPSGRQRKIDLGLAGRGFRRAERCADRFDDSRSIAIEAGKTCHARARFLTDGELALTTGHSLNCPPLNVYFTWLNWPANRPALSFLSAGINCPTTIEAQLGDFDVPRPVRSDHDLGHSTRIDRRNAT